MVELSDQDIISTQSSSHQVNHFYRGKDSILLLASQLVDHVKLKMHQELLNAWEVADILSALDDLMKKKLDWLSDFLEIANAFVSRISKDKTGQDALDFFRIALAISDQPEVANKFINLLRGGWWSSDLNRLLEKVKSTKYSFSWIKLVPVWNRFLFGQQSA